jgi:hypothetical protein
MKQPLRALSRLSAIALTASCALVLAACGGGGGGDSAAPAPVSGGPAPSPSPAPTAAPSPSASPTATPAPTATPTASPTATPSPLPTISDAQAYQVALKLWRNDDLTKHPKGSCAGCHGADFFDLARIGSTDTDLTRRAEIDGASKEEAAALVQAIRKMRVDFKLPVTNAREFRPFQPGGAVLLPGLTDPPHIVGAKRDIAFAKQLEPLLPTLFGARIETLAQAKKARDEMLDLAQGTNNAGANPTLLNLRRLPTGVVYPLWSADVHHGAKEGTFNDWVADIAHDAKPETKAQWHTLQDAYLTDPSDVNFWKMFAAAKDMTRVPLLGACTIGGINPALACGATDNFNRDKFLSALIGQHMLRMEALGRPLDQFMRGPLAFSYLDNDANFAFMKSRGSIDKLPANPWEIGDQGRTMLETTMASGSFKDNLTKLGYPKFAVDSIDPLRSAGQEEQALRLAWFWIGFTMDASFARISGSNATKVGEYMVGSLLEENMFLHNAFAQHMRLITKGMLQEANVRMLTRPDRVDPLPVKYLMNYGYFWGYNRTVLDTKWVVPNKGTPIPEVVKSELNALFGRFTGNGFRMSMLLQTEAMDNSQISADETTQLKGWLENTVNTNGSIRYGGARAMEDHFNRYHTATLAADLAMVEALEKRLGITY